MSKIEDLKQSCVDEIVHNNSVLLKPNVVVGERCFVKSLGPGIRRAPILYFDLPYSSPSFMKTVGEIVGRSARSMDCSQVCGIETQGIPLACAASIVCDLRFSYVRKSIRTLGEASYFTGQINAEETIMLVDNFCFSGETLSDASAKLTSIGSTKVAQYSLILFENPELSWERVSSIAHTFKIAELVDALIERGYFHPDLVAYVRLFIERPESFVDKSEHYLEFIKVYRRVTGH